MIFEDSFTHNRNNRYVNLIIRTPDEQNEQQTAVGRSTRYKSSEARRFSAD